MVSSRYTTLPTTTTKATARLTTRETLFSSWGPYHNASLPYDPGSNSFTHAPIKSVNGKEGPWHARVQLGTLERNGFRMG